MNLSHYWEHFPASRFIPVFRHIMLEKGSKGFQNSICYYLPHCLRFQESLDIKELSVHMPHYVHHCLGVLPWKMVQYIIRLTKLCPISNFQKSLILIFQPISVRFFSLTNQHKTQQLKLKKRKQAFYLAPDSIGQLSNFYIQDGFSYLCCALSHVCDQLIGKLITV